MNYILHISRKRWILWSVVSLLMAFTATALLGMDQARAATKAKAEPAQIARGVHQWSAYLAKQAGSTKALDKNNKRAVPFWNAVKRLNAGAAKLQRDLAAKRPTYLDALGDTRSAYTSVQVTYEQSGAKSSRMEKALTNIGRGLSLLERHAGPTRASKSRAKGLSAKQKRQLEAMKAKQKELQSKLRQVESKVRSNRAAIRAIRDIRAQSDRSYNAGITAADFFAALMAARIVDGLLWGWHWWWGPWGGWVGPWCGGFVDIYYDAVHVIDIDISVIDTEIAIKDYVLDADLYQGELDAIDDELAHSDFELSDADLGAIAEPGIGEEIDDVGAETLPTDELPDSEVSPEIDELPTPEVPPEVDELPAPEPEQLPEPDVLPEVESHPEPDPLPEAEQIPEPEAFPEPEPPPSEDAPGLDMPAEDLGGFDAGGFDDGGMDIDAGGIEFDGGGEF
jgi:hypothetical protein